MFHIDRWGVEVIYQIGEPPLQRGRKKKVHNGCFRLFLCLEAFLSLLLFPHLLVVSELDGLHLLRSVLVIVEVVLDGERLQQLHSGL